ncbi:hypothetical protein [Rhizobium sp. Root1203]|uniref:hypothetical protein n=1 Tax=Rhizobium sp. Root1203 TaxID=1736427 RepID=UPI0012E3BEF6|nr:hypothetical protein [Rhizobium sp. Root1203]
MANSRAVEKPPVAESKAITNVGSVHIRFAAGRKPAMGSWSLPLMQVRTRETERRIKTQDYNGLHEILINRKKLLECSKNAKKSDDKAQSLS